MQLGFWNERWEQGQIGFHSSEVNRLLMTYWDRVSQRGEGKVFVPMCGKTLDLLWLSRQGYEVIGCEISQVAVQDFFSENDLKAVCVSKDGFDIWTAENITIYCGDFFEMQPSYLQGCSVVYDRASLIAMPESMQQKYAKKMISLCKIDFKILLITLDYPQEEMSGPPFSVNEERVSSYYQSHFSIENLTSHCILNENSQFKKRGLSELKESVFLLTALSGIS